MKEWIVKMTGSVDEYYTVEAETEEQAQENWHTGHLDHSEAYDMDFVSVTLDYDPDEE